MKRNIGILFLCIVTLCISSCQSVKDVPYFQDLKPDSTVQAVTVKEITIKPDDKLAIIVKSRDPKLASLFNLSIVANNTGVSEIYDTQDRGIAKYTVDDAGNIDFPVLGRIHVGGLTRETVSRHIKQLLTDRQLLTDAVVTVEYDNLYISIMGEVNRPGRYQIKRDQLNILDALSMAGDLTIYGERKNIKILRQENGQQKAYSMDLTSARNMLASPAYYLQQNDIVYVEPNKTRARQSTVNGNNLISTSFWISIASLIASVTSIIVR